MNVFNFISAVACLCLVTGCGNDDKTTSTTSEPTANNPLTAPVDYVGAVGQAQKSAQRTLASAELEQAIRNYQIENGRFPKGLNELVTEGALTKIPPVPRGMRYDYDPATGALKIVPQ